MTLISSTADLSDLLLTWIITYGPTIIALALFLGAIGLPIPGSFLVIATGAFIRQDVLNIWLALPISLIGVVLGDLASYSMGRFARQPILKRFGQAKSWQRAENNLQQRGGIAVYLTRWLITPIAVPTNLVAGTAAYPLPRFLTYDIAGELTWFLIYGGLGYTFGSQWETISTFISDFSGVIIGAVILAAGIYFLFTRT